MRSFRVLLLGLPLLALSATHAREAAACGGCFVSQTENTQVSSHRMVLSVSPEETTLWDQIAYAGNPASFGWVLPIKGQVDIGLSSDAMFAALDASTQVQIASPTINCTPPPSCGNDNFAGSPDGDGAAGTSGEPPVEVLAHEVVGPYETVQLKSDDPQALSNWLADNGYTIPDEVAPIIAAYVAEQFNFLALKLVPGQGVDAMRPVRVTSAGSSPTLPLRMVAAGTGAVTPITLWVMGEGLYEPTNFASFLIGAEALTWNWDTQSSNFSDLRTQRFADAGGAAWHLEAGEPFSSYNVEGQLEYLVDYDPGNSGYGGDKQTPREEMSEDMMAMFGQLDRANLWVSRLYGELSRSALSTDLQMGAVSAQTPVNRFLQVTKQTGTAPACPTFPPCDDGLDGDGFGNGSGDGFDTELGGGGGCAMSEGAAGTASGLAAVGILAAAATIAVRRRRRNR
ncbi:MAG: DUF2330 domain-containing protein [Polyangiaceae bacterium]